MERLLIRQSNAMNTIINLEVTENVNDIKVNFSWACYCLSCTNYLSVLFQQLIFRILWEFLGCQWGKGKL